MFSASYCKSLGYLHLEHWLKDPLLNVKSCSISSLFSSFSGPERPLRLLEAALLSEKGLLLSILSRKTTNMNTNKQKVYTNTHTCQTVKPVTCNVLPIDRDSGDDGGGGHGGGACGDAAIESRLVQQRRGSRGPGAHGCNFCLFLIRNDEGRVMLRGMYIP